MKHRRGRRRGRGLDLGPVKQRWRSLTVALLASLFFAWLIIRTAIVNEIGLSRPRAAAFIAPEDPRVTAGLVNLEMRRRMGKIRPVVKRVSREALLRAPLMEEPFLLAGIDRLLRRDQQGAHLFLSHALKRNVRSRVGRLFMLELSLRGGDVKQAIAEMTILSRLMPDVENVFVPELARMAQEPKTRPTLRKMLQSDPRMLELVLNHLATKGDNPDIVLELAGNLRTVSGEVGDWRQGLMISLVNRGDVARARRLWSYFGGGAAEANGNLIYDGDFEGHQGLPPFNWSLSSGNAGVAETDKSKALEVEYYGRADAELATQLLALPPGRYRFSFRAEGDLKGPAHRLIWRVQCVDGKTTPLQLPLSKITFAGRNIAVAFTVPPGCPGQWLKLVGEPTEFPKNESVSIRNLKIQKMGGAS
ncbi:MAG: hypothetical protein JWN69_2002 [Alphaproteobacteria bacterium]|nr:hypothetical protein [Alphaproteobacteria bacterium]